MVEEGKYATKIFGDRLRELSDARGSYSKIARDLGINRQQFARYLNGSSRPRDAIIKKMAEYFDVDTGTFFQNRHHSIDQDQSRNTDSALITALVEVMGHSAQESISERDLQSGIYMRYNQSFTQPDKIVCILSKIYRTAHGVTRCKRRYSVHVAKKMPGVEVSHTAHGVFIKNLGTLILLEVDGVAGDLTFSAFKPASMYSVANRLKTGVVMTHGRPGGIGPAAGRHILEAIPEKDSILSWARKQGFYRLEELPDYIQHHFQPPPYLPASIMASR